jgi:hypothetical protein|eukprot:COSAG06_NODE_18_length_34640_cov_31.179989_13_plen_88_part_00
MIQSGCQGRARITLVENRTKPRLELHVMYVNAIKQDISALSGGDGIDCWQIRYAHTDDGEPHDWVTKSNRTDRIPYHGTAPAYFQSK